MPCSPQSTPLYLRVSANTSSEISRTSSFLGGVLHVEGGPHVQAARVDMSEHAVDEAATVERRAKLRDVIGEILRRNDGVLDERDRALFAFHVAEQSHRLLAHGPDRQHRRLAARDGVAAPSGAALVTAKKRLDPRQFRFERRVVVGEELDEIHALRRSLGVVGKVFRHAEPYRITASQCEHRGVDRLARCGLHSHERAASRNAASNVS